MTFLETLETFLEPLEAIYTTHDAPWNIIEFEANCKTLRESGRYFGVESKSGDMIGGYTTLATAVLMATAPEMAGLIERIAKDDQSEYQQEAKLLLAMMEKRITIRKENQQ